MRLEGLAVLRESLWYRECISRLTQLILDSLHPLRELAVPRSQNTVAKASSTRKADSNGKTRNGNAKNGVKVAIEPTVDKVKTRARETPEDLTGKSHVDDPVRMYLMQMGEIPMLNRDEEVDSAKCIEKTRTKFRRTMLCNDFVLHGAVDLLEKVSRKELRLDRTIEISVTNAAEKKRVLQRIGPNLETMHGLLAKNTPDYLQAIDQRETPAVRRAAWRRLIVRRNKVIRLVEEMNLRIQRLIPIMDQLHEIGHRMAIIKEQLANPDTLLGGGHEQELRHELRYLMRITHESPATLAHLVARTKERREKYDAAKRRLSAANLRVGRLHRQALPQPWLELLGFDSRRQHGAHAGR